MRSAAALVGAEPAFVHGAARDERLAPGPLAAVRCPVMVLRLSAMVNGEARQWLVEGPNARIGRASGNLVQVLDGTVSKEHAELAYANGAWTLRDLGSRNGTRVNGRDARAPQGVKAGDRIEVGHVLLDVHAAADPETTRFSISESVGSSLSLKVSDVLAGSSGVTADGTRVMRLLAEAGQLLVLPRPLPETCEAILGLVEKAVRASRLVILLRHPATGELQQVAARYRGGRAEEPLALSQTITRAVLAENTAVITGDALNDERFKAGHSIFAQGIHSAMAVPLFDNEKVLGILYADSTVHTVVYTQADLELLTLLGNMAAVKITNARLLEAEQMRLRMAQELATATRIQTNLLPEPPAVSGWTCHARVETCYEVGGDLYDFHVRPDGTLVMLVGDVSGKGMGAALLMSSTLLTARVLYDDCAGPLALVRRLNATLHRSIEARSFVTVFVGWLEPDTGRLRYVNAGHPDPHVVRGGQSRTLEATGIPVGMLPDFPWQEAETVIEPGALLAVFSDGIPEAQHGAEFFDAERVQAAMIEAATEADVARAAERVIARIDEFAAGEHRADDVTLVLMRRS